MLELKSIAEQVTLEDLSFVFKTAMGSLYFGDSKGATQRYKVPHAGHNPTDKGMKKPSHFTLYLNSEDTALISHHIYKANPSFILIREDHIVIADVKERRPVRVVEKDIPFSRVPAVGLSPYEVYTCDEVPSGVVATYHHLGNKIVQLETV